MTTKTLKKADKKFAITTIRDALMFLKNTGLSKNPTGYYARFLEAIKLLDILKERGVKDCNRFGIQIHALDNKFKLILTTSQLLKEIQPVDTTGLITKLSA